ncbi:MAG: hypothetical protein V2I33_19155 [Kangiellaceae bacterium]|jgi:hypothetical protein|nr:hypothetical protein [Kangiellaceae bacterium]
MNITLGLYALFLVCFFVAIPGYILRRFYFFGEFTKVLNHRKNPIRNITYSLFFGVCTSILVVSLINLFEKGLIDLEEILTNFDSKFINRGDKRNEVFTGLSSSIYKTYIPYLILLYAMSATIGYVFHRFVLLTNFDTKFKLLRYKNPWHYLFTGRLLKTNKFKRSTRNGLRVKYTYLDVLTCDQGGNDRLYSGLYIDYQLNSSNPEELNKLYLIEPSRYSKTLYNQTIKKNIPGSILTIRGNTIQNLNITYVFEEINEALVNRFSKLKTYKFTFDILLIIAFMFFFTAILTNIKISSAYWYSEIMKSNIILKLLWAFLFNMLTGLFDIFVSNDKDLKFEFIGWIKLGEKILYILVVFALLLIFHSVIYDTDWVRFFSDF